MVTKAMASNQSLYDRDFYAWANEQAALLRKGKLAEADIPNIAEEIESMGRREMRELVSYLVALLVHLLKWQYQPAHRSKGWRLSINQQRIRLASHFKDNPSLMLHLDEALGEAFNQALVEAQCAMGFDTETFPKQCQWELEKILLQDWVPE